MELLYAVLCPGKFCGLLPAKAWAISSDLVLASAAIIVALCGLAAAWVSWRFGRRMLSVWFASHAASCIAGLLYVAMLPQESFKDRAIRWALCPGQLCALAPPDPRRFLNMLQAFMAVSTLLSVSLPVTCYVCMEVLTRTWRYLATLVTWWLNSAPPNQRLRKAFNSLPFPRPIMAREHTHPNAAGFRNAATEFAESLAAALGIRVYWYQMSRANQVRGTYAKDSDGVPIQVSRGSRLNYWAKDYNASPMNDSVGKGDLVCMIDVDYYLTREELAFLLTSQASAYLLWTATPAAACGSDGPDTHFTFIDNELVTTVTGGAEYRHKLWNYSPDTLCVLSASFTNGLVYQAFNVEKRTFGSRSLVCLIPLARWTGLTAVAAYQLLACPRINRFEPRVTIATADGPVHYIRFNVLTDKGLYVTTGREGQYINATIPAVADEEIQHLARRGKVDVTIQACVNVVQRVVPDQAYARTAAVLLAQFHGSAPYARMPVAVHAPPSSRHITIGHGHDLDAPKPLNEQIMEPILPAYVHTHSVATAKDAIERRVKIPASDSSPPMNEDLLKYMREFALFTVPVPHLLRPVEVDEVYERQPRPSQQAILHTADVEGRSSNTRIKSFLKAELPGGPDKAARVISTFDGDLKLRYSSYIYALAELVMEHEWAMLGKTPLDIAGRVAAVLSNAETVTPTDFEKYDGHEKAPMRLLERMIAMRAFHPDTHAELSDLMDKQFSVVGEMRIGDTKLTYDTGLTRGSGAPETGLFNMLCNAFTAYAALRRMRPDGDKLEPLECFKRLGAYLGDDGLTPDVNLEVYKSVAAELGQVLTGETIHRGKPVDFLARYYTPEAWYSDGLLPSSMADVSRALRNLAFTVNLAGLTAVEKLEQKCIGYVLSDGNTPGLGTFARRVTTLLNSNLDSEDVHRLRSYNSRVARDSQYPNAPGEWMLDQFKALLPAFELEAFEKWVNSCTKIEELMHCPRFYPAPEIDTKIKVVVDDQPSGTVDPPVAASPPAPAPPAGTFTAIAKVLNSVEALKTAPTEPEDYSELVSDQVQEIEPEQGVIVIDGSAKPSKPSKTQKKNAKAKAKKGKGRN